MKKIVFFASELKPIPCYMEIPQRIIDEGKTAVYIKENKNEIEVNTEYADIERLVRTYFKDIDSIDL